MGLVVSSRAHAYDFFTYYFTLVISVMYFFSGIFFPLASLPVWAQRGRMVPAADPCGRALAGVRRGHGRDRRRRAPRRPARRAGRQLRARRALGRPAVDRMTQRSPSTERRFTIVAWRRFAIVALLVARIYAGYKVIQLTTRLGWPNAARALRTARSAERARRLSHGDPSGGPADQGLSVPRIARRRAPRRLRDHPVGAAGSRAAASPRGDHGRDRA